VYSILQLVAGSILVIIGGLLFTSSLEFLASKFRFTTSLTGAVISPILTSLPELTVIIVALIHGGVEGSEISIGTVIGEPFMASTIIYPMLILTALISYFKKRRRSPRLRPDREVVIPFIVFTILFPIVLIPHYISNIYMKYLVGISLLASYFIYVILTTRSGKVMSVEHSSEVVFSKIIKNIYAASILQLILSILFIYFGSRNLVDGVIYISKIFNIDPQLLSIVIIPSVSALPESVVGLVWAYNGKDTLALESIVGEKVLYSTFYPGIAIFVTEWILKLSSIFCIFYTTLISLIMIFYILRQDIGFEVAILGLAGYILYILTMLHIL